MSNIVLDANDHTGLWDKSFLLLMDKDEIVEGLEDLSKVPILVLWYVHGGEKKGGFHNQDYFFTQMCISVGPAENFS